MLKSNWALTSRVQLGKCELLWPYFSGRFL